MLLSRSYFVSLLLFFHSHFYTLSASPMEQYHCFRQLKKRQLDLLNTFITSKLSVFWCCAMPRGRQPSPLKLINLCISIICQFLHCDCVFFLLFCCFVEVVVLPIPCTHNRFQWIFVHSQFKVHTNRNEIHTDRQTDRQTHVISWHSVTRIDFICIENDGSRF